MWSSIRTMLPSQTVSSPIAFNCTWPCYRLIRPRNLCSWKPRINPCSIPPAPRCSVSVIMLSRRPTHGSWSCYVVTVHRINGLGFCCYFILPAWQRYNISWTVDTWLWLLQSPQMLCQISSSLRRTENCKYFMTSFCFFLYVTNRRITENKEVQRM